MDLFALVVASYELQVRTHCEVGFRGDLLHCDFTCSALEADKPDYILHVRLFIESPKVG